jgi:hypothetical protein
MTLELIILDGSDRRFSLLEGSEMTVGASARCAIRLEAPDVSRNHALLTLYKGQLVVLDLGSTNGTFVNGKPIKEHTLEVGDCIRFSSVLAQVVPTGESPSSPETFVLSGDKSPSSSGSLASPGNASQPVAVILQESLISLLRSWNRIEPSALNTLAEWVVSHRGHRGIVFLEPMDGDLVVLGAHGEIEELLQHPKELPRLRQPTPLPETGIESLTLDLASGPVVAIRAPGAAWLILRVGVGMPDTLEMELYTRLFDVARRLDQPEPRRQKAGSD